MRWIVVTKPKPEIGDKKIVDKFLFWPRCINREWRWWEYVKMEVQYDYWTSFWVGNGWVPIRWVDENKE